MAELVDRYGRHLEVLVASGSIVASTAKQYFRDIGGLHEFMTSPPESSERRPSSLYSFVPEADFAAWMASLTGREGGPVSGNTWKRRLAAVRHFLRWGAGAGVPLAANPDFVLTARPPRGDPKRPRLKDEHVVQLIGDWTWLPVSGIKRPSMGAFWMPPSRRWLWTRGPPGQREMPTGGRDDRLWLRNHTLVVVGLMTSLRISEVVSLRLSDICLTNKDIGATRRRDIASIADRVIVRGKGGREGTVFVPPYLKMVLWAYILVELPLGGPWLFPSPTRSGHLSSSTAYSAYSSMCKALGIKATGFHATRRWFATFFVRREIHRARQEAVHLGTDPGVAERYAEVAATSIVSRILRHKDLDTTRRYIGTILHEEADAASIKAAFAPSPSPELEEVKK